MLEALVGNSYQVRSTLNAAKLFVLCFRQPCLPCAAGQTSGRAVRSRRAGLDTKHQQPACRCHYCKEFMR